MIFTNTRAEYQRAYDAIVTLSKELCIILCPTKCELPMQNGELLGGHLLRSIINSDTTTTMLILF